MTKKACDQLTRSHPITLLVCCYATHAPLECTFFKKLPREPPNANRWWRLAFVSKRTCNYACGRSLEKVGHISGPHPSRSTICSEHRQTRQGAPSLELRQVCRASIAEHRPTWYARSTRKTRQNFQPDYAIISNPPFVWSLSPRCSGNLANRLMILKQRSDASSRGQTGVIMGIS